MTISKTEGRESSTLYERLGESAGKAGLSLLLCTLVTGRTHQIRVHLKAIHLPIVGDATYGSPRWRGNQGRGPARRVPHLPAAGSPRPPARVRPPGHARARRRGRAGPGRHRGAARGGGARRLGVHRGARGTETATRLTQRGGSTGGSVARGLGQEGLTAPTRSRRPPDTGGPKRLSNSWRRAAWLSAVLGSHA